ncbi:MAG TPA: hypothetical protein VGP47_02800 [Parachlamydiaceae bacterium]|nr:hypothetical protein [Parachlamydiaceae bacterium]
MHKHIGLFVDGKACLFSINSLILPILPRSDPAYPVAAACVLLVFFLPFSVISVFKKIQTLCLAKFIVTL